jgi:HAD superfamily hydrolase (TIGR01549 family)
VRRYAALIFDLFDTLVLFDEGKIPLIQVGGEVRRSTIGRTYAALRQEGLAVPWEDFVGTLLGVDEELRAIREGGREVSSRERFRRILSRLGLGESGLLDQVVRKHQEALLACTWMPAEHRETLKSLARRFPLALLSNFDDSESVRRLLVREGLEGLFEAVCVSEDIGWRKPDRRAFDEPLRALGLAAERALFVGDSYEADVLGAKGVGMDAAWMNRRREERPPGSARADYEVSSLEELAGLLGGTGPR